MGLSATLQVKFGGDVSASIAITTQPTDSTAYKLIRNSFNQAVISNILRFVFIEVFELSAALNQPNHCNGSGVLNVVEPITTKKGLPFGRPFLGVVNSRR